MLLRNALLIDVGGHGSPQHAIPNIMYQCIFTPSCVHRLVDAQAQVLRDILIQCPTLSHPQLYFILILFYFLWFILYFRHLCRIHSTRKECPVWYVRVTFLNISFSHPHIRLHQSERCLAHYRLVRHQAMPSLETLRSCKRRSGVSAHFPFYQRCPKVRQDPFVE